MKKLYYLAFGCLLIFTGCGSSVNSEPPPDPFFRGVAFEIYSSDGKEIAAFAACPDDRQVISVSCQFIKYYGGIISSFFLENNAGYCITKTSSYVIPTPGTAYLTAYVTCAQNVYDTGSPTIVTDPDIDTKRQARRDQILTDLGFDSLDYP